MRRSQIVLGATVAGTVGVLAFHTSPPAVSGTATNESATTSSQATAATPTTSATTSQTTSPVTTAAASPTSTSAAAPSGSATGSAISTRYGDVQVRVTVKNGKITNVQPVQLTNADSRSVEISDSAAPLLNQEALSKQSANIDAISGATYTSAGYAQSLQSALNKLGFKTAATTLQVPS